MTMIMFTGKESATHKAKSSKKGQDKPMDKSGEKPKSKPAESCSLLTGACLHCLRLGELYTATF